MSKENNKTQREHDLKSMKSSDIQSETTIQSTATAQSSTTARKRRHML